MWLERTATILSIVATLAGGWYFMDGHYAKAGDLKDLKREFKQDSIDTRKKQVEDKIFELEFKRSQTPSQFKALDDALLNRYNRELRDLREKERNLNK